MICKATFKTKTTVGIIFLFFLCSCSLLDTAKALILGDKESLSEYKIGFGVTGHGKPLIDGDYLYIPPGEGDITEINIKNKSKPKLSRFLETKYFFHDKIFKVGNYLYFNSVRGGDLASIDLRKDVYVTYTIIERYIDSDVKLLGKDFGTLRGVYDTQGFFVADNKIKIYNLEKPSSISKILEIDGYSDLYIDRSKKIGLFFNDNLISKFSLVDHDSGQNKGKNNGQNKPVKILDKKIDLKNKQIFFGDNNFFILDGKEIAVYHIEGLDNIFNIKLTLDEPSVIRDIVSKDNKIFILDARRGGGAHSVNKSSPHSRIYVFDSDKREFIGKYEDSNITEYAYATIDGNYLYVNDYNFGIRIFDITNPSTLKQISNIPTACEGRFGGVINNDLAYIGSTFGGHIFFVNVKDKEKPSLASLYWDGSWGKYWMRMVSHKDFLYVPKNESVEILNIKNPQKPTRVGEITYENGKTIGGSSIFKIDNYLYTVSLNDEGMNLLTYDLTTPENPKLKSKKQVDLKGRILIGTLKDQIVLGSEGEKKILLFDTKDKENPRLILTYELRDPIGKYFIAYNSYIYTLPQDRYDTSFYIYKFDGLKMTYIKKASFTTGIVRWSRFFTDGIVVKDGVKDKLFMNSYDFINIIDLKNPEEPKIIDKKFVGYKWTIGGYLDGYLYVPTLRGLKILKID